MKRLGIVGSLCLLAVICLFWSAPAAAAPRIGLSPDTGPPTSKVTVRGKGFFPNVNVDIYFDALDQALVTTTATGEFSLTIDAPSAAQPGEHWITAKERLGRISPRAAQKPFLVRTDWAMFRFGNTRQGWNPYENTLNSSNVGNLSLAWKSVPTAGCIYSSPSVAGGSVYVGTESNRVYAFNATDGTPQWCAQAGPWGGVYSSPAVANGTVYIGSANGNFYAFQAATGSLLWKALSQAGWTYGFTSSPAVANGLVYAGSWDAYLYAFNSQDGAKTWDSAFRDEVDSSTSVYGGKVFLGNGNRLYALKADTGDRLWSVKIDKEFFLYSSPVVADGVIYLASYYGKLYAFQAANGKPYWRSPAITGSSISSSPAVAGGVVYVSSENGMLHAFKAADGTPLWSVPVSIGYSIHSSPAVANGVVYVGSFDGNLGNLYAFDADSGALLWSGATGSFIWSSPAVADGMVYVGSGDRCLYAFSLYGRQDHPAIPRPDPGSLVPDRSRTPRPSQ